MICSSRNTFRDWIQDENGRRLVQFIDWSTCLDNVSDLETVYSKIMWNVITVRNWFAERDWFKQTSYYGVHGFHNGASNTYTRVTYGWYCCKSVSYHNIRFIFKSVSWSFKLISWGHYENKIFILKVGDCISQLLFVYLRQFPPGDIRFELKNETHCISYGHGWKWCMLRCNRLCLYI